MAQRLALLRELYVHHIEIIAIAHARRIWEKALEARKRYVMK
jgi:hypothetical protein